MCYFIFSITDNFTTPKSRQVTLMSDKSYYLFGDLSLKTCCSIVFYSSAHCSKSPAHTGMWTYLWSFVSCLHLWLFSLYFSLLQYIPATTAVRPSYFRAFAIAAPLLKYSFPRTDILYIWAHIQPFGEVITAYHIQQRLLKDYPPKLAIFYCYLKLYRPYLFIFFPNSDHVSSTVKGFYSHSWIYSPIIYKY